MKRRLFNPLLLAGLAILLCAVYYAGLHGPLVFDDVVHIPRNPHLALEDLSWANLRDAAMSGDSVYPRRGLARLSFALNYYIGGASVTTIAYKATNLGIHVLNALLVYALSAMLLRRYAGGLPAASATAGWSALNAYLPVLAAAVWALHPIQLTAVLYVVQRMTSLSALCVFAGLLTFLAGRVRVEGGRPLGFVLMLVGLGAGSGLGFLCKENALLLPLLAFLVELFFFRREALPRPSRGALAAFYSVTVAVPVLVALAALWWQWGFIEASYESRDYGVVERLWTQSRILVFYLALLFIPNLRWYGLYHDDIETSRGWLEPWSTLPSAALWLVLLALAIASIRRRSLWGFAILWYLAGHAMESSVLGLEMVFEHRNYVPSFGVLVVAAYYVVRWLQGTVSADALRYAFPCVLVVGLALATAVRAATWNDEESMMRSGVRNHPQSSRYHAGWALVLSGRAGSDLAEIVAHLQRAASLNRNEVLALGVMASAVRYRILALQRQGAREAGGHAASAPIDVLSTPLPDDLAPLERFEAALTEEITRRMRERPVIATTMEVAFHNYMCVRAGMEHCAAMLPTVIGWYRVAVDENPRNSDSRRAVMMVQLAKLYALSGQIDLAVEYAERGAALERGGIELRMSLALLYLTLGDLDQAARALQAAEEANPAGFRADQLAEFKRAVAQAQRSSEAAGSAP